MGKGKREKSKKNRKWREAVFKDSVTVQAKSLMIYYNRKEGQR